MVCIIIYIKKTFVGDLLSKQMTEPIQADNWTNKYLSKRFPQLPSAPGLLGHAPTAPPSSLGSKRFLFVQQIGHFYSKWESSSFCAITEPKSRRHLHQDKTHFRPRWFTRAKTHPGIVADMFSRMHLHCCRWWSFQIRAVPSRLPLTNLARDSDKHQAPSLYTPSHSVKRVLWILQYLI